MAKIGHALASRGEFADPYVIPTGPTAHHAPVYPMMLAGIYHYLPEQAWLPARAWLNIVLSSLVCAMAYLAGAALRLGQPPSFAVAVVLALLPARAAVEICNDQEAGLVAFMAALAIWASARFAPSRKWRAVWIGLIWGIALLSAPALVLIFACYLVWLGRQRENRLGAAGIALVVTAVLLPWTLRNHARLGGWFFVRDSPWLELAVSNADTAVANPSQNAERGAMQLYHPLFNRAAAERVRSHGELQEYAELRRVALRWIASHPAQFARLTLQRIWIFWIPFGTSRPWMLWRCALYPLAVVGLALLCSGNHRAALLLGSMLVVYPLPYYFVQCYSRYGYPVEWAVTLAAGHAVASLIRRRRLNRGAR